MATLEISHENPSQLRLVDLSQQQMEKVKAYLTFIDRSAEFQQKKFAKNRWFINRYGEERFREELNRLKSLVTKTALWEDDSGTYTLSGLASEISELLKVPLQSTVKYEEGRMLAWAKVPPKLRPYQIESVEKLLEIKHGAVNLATGMGKSHIILHLAKSVGKKTLVMAPSSSIAKQLYDSFVMYVGKKHVGMYVGAKKEFNKLFVIGTAQSFTRIEPGTPQWEALSKTEVFIGDESHTTPAKTLFKICSELVSSAPYRFFFSATQIRNDGFDKILRGVIGPIVINKTVMDGVQEGYLAKPIFRVIKTRAADTSYMPEDPNEVTRNYLYYNKTVIGAVAKTVNMALAAGMPTVVLIEEIEQFTKLLPLLTHRPVFAHGPLNEAQKKGLDGNYWDSEPNDLVKAFNEGKEKLLIGTSCISMGTDIQAVKALVYWQGGKSEIQVKQAIGRSTRLCPGKTECLIVDIDVVNVPTVHRHAKARIAMYQEMCPPVEYIEM